MSKLHHSGDPRVSEETLAAYVDGMLSPQRRLEVESYLARNPEDAARVEAYIRQNRRLHEAYDRYLAEPLPESIHRLGERLRQRMTDHSRERPWRRLAGAALVGGLVAAVGWLSFERMVGPSSSEMLFSMLDRDMAGRSEIATQAAIEPASSKAGGEAVTGAPDFKPFGFSLVGTRLLKSSGGQGSGMQLVYESQNGARVYLYFNRGGGGESTGLTLQQEGAISVLFWHDAGRSYAMIGEVGRDTLLAMGKVVNGEWSAEPPDEGGAGEPSARSEGAGGQGREEAQPIDKGGSESAGQVDAKTEAASEPALKPKGEAREGGKDGERSDRNDQVEGSEGRDASEGNTESGDRGATPA